MKQIKKGYPVMNRWLVASGTCILCLGRTTCFTVPKPIITGSFAFSANRESKRSPWGGKLSSLSTLLNMGVNEVHDVNFGRRVVEQVHPSVAMILPLGVRNMTTQGTGFVVDTIPGNTDEIHFLTAAHVAAPGYGLEVKLPGVSNCTAPATVVARHVPSDLALIRVERNNQDVDDAFFSTVGEPLELATNEESKNSLGSIVFANGYPAGITGGPAITMGIVCGFANGFSMVSLGQRNTSDDNVLHANTIFVVTDAAMSSGMSGGPLVDSDGKVLGVNALVRPDMRSLGNYAVSAKTCRDFLDGVENLIGQAKDGAAEKTTGFRVVLYNDPMNKRERVARILREVAQLNETMAESVMMSAHTTGSGIVKEFLTPQNRSEADAFCQALKEQDVLAEVQEMVA